MTLTATIPQTSLPPSTTGWRWPDRPALMTYLRYAGITALLFVIGYGGANWLAARQATHLQLYWGPELAIPLIPQALWIYLSIDLLFLLPVFRLDRSELAWLGRGMIAATLIAAVIFVVMPTTPGFARLEAAEGSHPAFAVLYALDFPYNCVPSLHVAYSALIMIAIGRHAGGMLRAALGVWFSAIVASTLLTHQHHLIDAVAALVLAALLCGIRWSQARKVRT